MHRYKLAFTNIYLIGNQKERYFSGNYHNILLAIHKATNAHILEGKLENDVTVWSPLKCSHLL
jgi:hypothetical protein